VTTVTPDSPAATRLSPPPRSRALSLTASVAALAVLVVTVLLGVTTVQSSAPGTTARVVGWLLCTVGAVASAGVVAVALRSLAHSRRAARAVGEGDVLAGRESAARAIQSGYHALALTVVLVVGLVSAGALTAHDSVLQQTFLRWDLIGDSATDVVAAFRVNLWIAVVAEVIVLVVGLLLAVARLTPGPAGRPVRALAIAYIDGMRAVPAIIVIYLVGFGLPLLQLPVLSDLPRSWFAIVALSLTYSAYAAETYRAGIEAIHPSQWSATRSIGFSYGQTLRFVILPQAIRGVIPPLLSLFIALQKDTSLVNVIGALDAFNQAKFYASQSFNLSAVTLVAVMFILITIPQTRFVDWMLARSAARSGRA
jgi:polar amino acid transport system permease protein